MLTLLWRTPGCQVLKTASIARLNRTLRGRLAVLGRRTRCSARRRSTVAKGMDVVGTLDNCCTLDAKLTTEDGRPPTPAMAAGMTDRVWSVSDLLH